MNTQTNEIKTKQDYKSMTKNELLSIISEQALNVEVNEGHKLIIQDVVKALFDQKDDDLVEAQKRRIENERIKPLQSAFEDLLYEHIKSTQSFIDDGITLSGGGRYGEGDEYHQQVKNVLDKMNDEDWNDDSGYCVLKHRSLTAGDCEIYIEFNSHSDEED